MIISDYITSLVDYPNKVCTTLFVPFCNLRCGYCYNHRLFKENNPKILPDVETVDVLIQRKQLTKYLCITGGEPTLQPDLPVYLRFLKSVGFKIKLDTNGTVPHIIERCLEHVDYIALDVKTSPDRYHVLDQFGNFKIENLRKSIKLIKESGVKYELRTVAFPFLMNDKTMEGLLNLVAYMGNPMLYRITQFHPEGCYLRWCKKVKPYSEEELDNLKWKAIDFGINHIALNI